MGVFGKAAGVDFLVWTTNGHFEKLPPQSVCRNRMPQRYSDRVWTRVEIRVLTMNARVIRSRFLLSLGVCLLGFGGGLVTPAQGQQLFSGSGIPTSNSGEQKSGWLASGPGKSGGESGFRLPWGEGSRNNNVVEPAGNQTGWLGLPRPSWLQPRDPNAPGFFEQANERSRAFWGRTQEGFSHFTTRTGESFKTMNQNIRTATSESWARITGAAKSGDPRSGEVKPPVGDNETWLNKNQDR